MFKLRSASYALGVLAFGSICAGCAGGDPQPVALDAPPVRLLFVSDKDANTVTIFSLPDLAVTGSLTGFSKPRGLCSDPDGNIWVANYGTQQMFEYTREGNLIKTITDPDGYPFACSDDGKLAYANKHNFGTPDPQASPDPPTPDSTMTPMSGPGETEVGNHSYDSPDLNQDLGVAWQNAPPGPAVTRDIHGTDLFIVGKSKTGKFVLALLPAGSTKIHPITVTGGTIHDAGMVQWYAVGHFLAVGDRRCGSPRTTCVYHIKIKGLIGEITGKTTFETYNEKPICDMAQGVIGASGEKFLAGGDDESSCSGRATSSVYRWHFPAGGAPTNNNSTLSRPFGTAISP